MRHFFLTLIMLTATSLCLKGADTIVVQTFTFDSIFTRQATFNFPSVEEKFERVIAKYRLKCDPKTQHDKYQCGEWDYTTHLKILKPTNEVKFNTCQHPVYTFGNFKKPETGTKFKLTSKPILDKIKINNVKLNAVSDNAVEIAIGNATEELGNFSRHQFLLTNKELKEKNIVEGTKIGKISFDAEILDTMKNVTLRIAGANKLMASKLIGYNTKFDFKEVAFQTFITKEDCIDGKFFLSFNEDFVYDGKSNLVFDITATVRPNVRNKLKGEFSKEDVGVTIVPSNYAKFDGNNAWIETIALPTISGKQNFTWEAWVKMEKEGTIFRLGDKVVLSANQPDDKNNMKLQVNFRSDMHTTVTSNNSPLMVGRWAHIALVFDGTNGEECKDVVKLFVNGLSVPLGFTNWYAHGWDVYLSRFIDDLPVRFSIGRGEFSKLKPENVDTKTETYLLENANACFAQVRVWDTSLTEQEIKDWKNKTFITEEHQKQEHLKICMLFMEEYGETSTFILPSLIPETPKAKVVGQVEFLASNDGPLLETQTNFLPNITLYTGDFTYSKEENTIQQERKQLPISIVYFSADNHYPEIERIDYKYSNYSYTYDENGNKIDSTEITEDIEEFTVENTLFDYETKHYPKKDVFELGRFITPYGINLSLGENGFEWEYNLTDYMNELRGNVEIIAHNNQELIDLKFLFIKGEPNREVLRISEPWGSVGSYTYKDLGTDKVVSDAIVKLLPETKSAKLKVRLTGHGMVPNTQHQSQCCEFLDNIHYLYAGPTVDKYEVAAEWKIWQNCTENPVWPQGGTWMLAREGWCPGDIVKDYEVDLTPYVKNNEVAINYQTDNSPLLQFPEIGTGNYIANFHLVEYAAAKYKNDLEVFKIITPSKEDIYSKLNPICNGIKFIVQNNSDEDIPSYEVILKNNGKTENYLIEQNIKARSYDTIVVSLNDPKFLATDNNNPEISIEVVVDGDEKSENNIAKARFSIPDTYNKDNCVIRYRSNLRPNDYVLKIYDFKNEVVKTYQAIGANSTSNIELKDLPNGCYRLEFEDTRYYYGLSSWMVPNQGKGAFDIVSNDGKVLKTFNPDFGKRIVYSFGLDNFESIATNDIVNSIFVYPNPTSEHLLLEVSEDFGLTKLKIYNIAGELVLEKNVELVAGQTLVLNIMHLQAGRYSICIGKDTESKWSTFIKQ